MELKAVIFDLDGVLCDTSIYHAQAWIDLVRGLGHEPPADLEERVKGISRMASLKIALGDKFDDYSAEEQVELATRKNDCYLNAIKHVGPNDIFDGVLDLFADLKSKSIKVALGSASKNARTVLKGLGIIDEFDAISDGFCYTHPKPHPEVFINGAHMVDAEPWQCIVVEDSEAGIEAALTGGFVALGMGNPESLRKSHKLIDSLTEVNADSLISLHGSLIGDCKERQAAFERSP